MKFKRVFKLSLLIVLFILAACNEKNNNLSQIVESVNDFSFKLFSKLPEDHSNNVFISPLSVSMTMSMALNGAEGNTKTQILTALNLDSLTLGEINSNLGKLITNLKVRDKLVSLDIDNSIWVKKGIPILEDFTAVSKKYFNATVENLDFDQRGVITINDWANKKTKGKISKILNSFSPNNNMILINTICFVGKWMYPFDLQYTEREKFNLSSGDSAFVSMMKTFKGFCYSEQPHFKALKIPYGKGEFNMMLILPKDKGTPESILREIGGKNWNKLRDSLKFVNEINLWLPKFQISKDVVLKKELVALGIEDAFETKADFSKINKVQNPFINDVIQKSYIKIDEKGTEVAIASGSVVTLSVRPEPPIFHLNRPFIFMIVDEKTGVILTIGKVENPELLN